MSDHLYPQGTVSRRLLERAEDYLVAVANIAEAEGIEVEELLEALKLIMEWKNGL